MLQDICFSNKRSEMNMTDLIYDIESSLNNLKLIDHFESNLENGM